MKKAAAYVRVSTADQTVKNQKLAIEKYCEVQNWKLVQTYEDNGISGSTDSRPALDMLKDDVMKGKYDVVVVFRFDRMARSTRHLLDCLQLFRKSETDFVSCSEGIDTSTAVGEMIFTFLAAISAFELSILRERVHAGIERAKAEGKHCGRPRVGIDLKKAMELKKQGLSYRAIAKQLGQSHATVYRALRAVNP